MPLPLFTYSLAREKHQLGGPIGINMGIKSHFPVKNKK